MNTGVASRSFVTWLVAVDTSSAETRSTRSSSVAFVLAAVADPIDAARRHRRPEGRRRDEARRAARQDRDAARAHRRVPRSRSSSGPRPRPRGSGSARTTADRAVVPARARGGAERRRPRSCPTTVRADRRGRARRRRARAATSRASTPTGASALRAAFGANPSSPRNPRSSIRCRRATRWSTGSARW